MQRISSQMNNNDLQYQMRLRELQINRINNQMGSQTKIQELRDDPIAAAQSVRVGSILRRAQQYERNVETIQSEYQIAESYIYEANNILHRINELTVQGAHGTYAKEDLQVMGQEVNELLKEILSLANATGSRGQSLFSGDEVHSEAFRAIETRVPGSALPMISTVEYTGSMTRTLSEIGEGTEVETNFLGNEVFWAEPNSIYGAFDTSNFRANADSSFFIDGQEIGVSTGDTVHSIVAKINDSGAAVRADLDPVTGSLVLNTTQNHQIWLDESPDSNVLQNLGLTSESGGSPPNNFHPDARVFGGSIFDVVMGVRDAMMSGDHEALGGRALAGMEQAMGRIGQSLTDLGARHRRIEFTRERLNTDITELTSRRSTLVDLDLTESITELNMMQNVHRAALGAAGRILQGSLLDYLR